MPYVLDLESRPDPKLVEVARANIKAPKNYKDAEKIDAYLAQKYQELDKLMATDPDYTDIVCIGVKKLGETPKIYQASELEQIFKDFSDEVMIGFNIKSFDIPVIIKYGIRHNLKLPYATLKMAMKKWQSSGAIDLMEIISDGRDWKSLDEYAQIYLGEKKEPIDFTTASKEEIEKHCLADCEMTEKLYNLFSVII